MIIGKNSTKSQLKFTTKKVKSRLGKIKDPETVYSTETNGTKFSRTGYHLNLRFLIKK